ncbi:MAG TPA: PDZ domain-containing protein, partial [Polyangiaceae bacterium]|nr:PDZ domain-containing protein [Polyangiaceae bacterium]
GLGFAEHHGGTLRLVGTLFTPGRSPRALDWSVAVQPEARSLLVVPLKDRHLDELLDGARHATFRGQLKLEFAPTLPGRPVLRGEHTLSLNLFGSSEPNSADAQAFVNYLGLKLSPSFSVVELSPGHAAMAAGLKPEDRVLALDGVDLDKLSDFVPAPHISTSTLLVRRPPYTQAFEVAVARADFQLLDQALLRQALACALGLGCAMLLIARPPRALLWLMGPKRRGEPAWTEWLEGVGPRLQPVSYLVFSLVCVGYSCLLSQPLPALAAFDFLLVLNLGVCSVLLGALLLGAATGRGRFSLVGAVTSLSTSVLLLLPVFIAALARAAEVGSLSLAEIDAAQGVWPTQWGALASPWSLVLAVSYLLALLPLAGRRPPVFGQRGEKSALFVAGRSLEWLGGLLLLSLWFSLFGGAQLFSSHFSWFLRSGIYCGKLALLGYGLSVLRTRAGYLRCAEAFTLWGPRNLAVSAVATGLLVGSWYPVARALTVDIKSAFSTTLLTAFLLLLWVAQSRSWWQRGRGSDPWI